MNEMVQRVVFFVFDFFPLRTPGHEQARGTWVFWETQAQVTKCGPTSAEVETWGGSW